MPRTYQPFVVGELDQGVDEKVARVGTVSRAQNMFRAKTGEWRKRSGRAAASSTCMPSGTLPEVWQLATHGGKLMALSEWGGTFPIASYSPSADAWGASAVVANSYPIRSQHKGTIVSEAFPVISDDDDSVTAIKYGETDAAVANGYAIVVFKRSAGTVGAREVIIDLTTKAKLASTAIDAAAGRSNVHVVTLGTSIVVVTADGTNITFREYVSAADMKDVTPTITTSATAAVNIQVMVYGSKLLVAGALAGGASARIVEYTAGGTVAASTLTCDNDNAMGWLADFGSSGRRFLATAGATSGVRVHVLDTSNVDVAGSPYTLDAAATTTAVEAITGHSTGSSVSGEFMALWTLSTSATDIKTRMAQRVGGVITTGADWILSVGLRSKTFRMSASSTDYLVMCTYPSDLQPTDYVFRFPTDAMTASPRVRAPVCKLNRLRARYNDVVLSAATGVGGALTGVSDDGAGGLYCAVPKIAQERNATTSVGDRNYTVDLVKLSADPANHGRPVEAAGTMFVPAGNVMSFDGVQYAEHDFATYPEKPSGVAAALGTGSLPAGDYKLVTVFKYVDGQGRIHRSSPSVPSATITAALNDSITATIPTLRFWGNLPPVSTNNMQVEVYLTEANGSTYYLHGTIDNSMTAHTVTRVINIPVRGDEELLYTTGDVLEATTPPQMRALAVHRDRVWGVDNDVPDRLWHSLPITPGLGVQWSETLTLDVDDEYGAVTALASLDDKLVVFKESAIYVVTGDGPDNLGRGAYTAAQRIATGTGTTQPRSVISFPGGVLYQSPKGIMILGRGLNVEAQDNAIDVMGLGDSQETIEDACVVETEAQVRLFTSNARQLVYDYERGGWSVYTGQGSGIGCRYGNGVAQVQSGGTVHLDLATGTFTDAGERYEARLTTSWLSMAGIGGYQRIPLVTCVGEISNDGSGEFSAARMALSYNFSSSENEVRMAVPSPSPFVVEVKPGLQKCNAIRVAVYDSRTGGSASGGDFRVSSIGLLVTPLPGGPRGQRMGAPGVE